MRFFPFWVFAIFAAVFASGARGALAADEDFITRMTDDNVALFLEEVREVSLGKRDDMMLEDIEAYLGRHLAPKGSFRSKTRFEIPGYPVQETEMKLGRDEYIENVLQGQNLIRDYETAVEIKSIKIGNGGKSAEVETVSTDRGKMPWPDSQGEEKLVSIEGKSTCAQRLIVSFNNYIQMADAACETVIKFLPFGDKPLGSDLTNFDNSARAGF